jgi:hypothetical protein
LLLGVVLETDVPTLTLHYKVYVLVNLVKASRIPLWLRRAPVRPAVRDNLI